MLESVDAAGREVVERSRILAEPLRGARIPRLSAAPYNRGGVADLPQSEVPLLWDLELGADCKTIRGGNEFFTVTKTVHNAPRCSTPDEKDFYLTYSTRNARLLEEKYDPIFTRGPIPEVRGRGDAKWVWRCHVDTSEPHPGPWEFSSPCPDGATTESVR